MVEKYGNDFLIKNICPFKYINSFNHYKESSFPDIKYFDTDQETYEKYRKFYYTNFNNLGEYSDYYLEKDMLLLTDVMEKYRTMFMEKYETESFSHYTINSLTWEMFKKYNPVQIKILDNYNIYSSCQSMLKFGLCGIGSTRYAGIVNNKYMKNYDPKQPSSFITRFDINGMYAHIMRSYPLPYDDFTYLNDEEIRDFNIWDYDESTLDGYILNIDILAIDISYHAYFIDLPIFPVKRKVYKKELSDYQKHILNVNEKQFICTEKLLLDYNPKKGYTIHYLTLKCYLKLGGFKIENIHYIIRFKQANYMKEYIEINHKNRCESNYENDKRMYKTLTNSLCGRSLLNKERFNSNII